MNVTDPFVLQRDLRDDDSETAALLALFREPRTLVDAVIEDSRALGRDPQQRLGELLPYFDALIEDHVLVPYENAVDCAAAAVGWLRLGDAAQAQRSIARAYELSGDDPAWRVHAAAAIVAADAAQRRAALLAFVEASMRTRTDADMIFGRSGPLLAAALLFCNELRPFGAETLRAIWAELDAGHPREGTFLGIAHGWAGFLYASLRWCAASGDALPPRLLARLDELAALKLHGGDLAASWCHGSAGQLFLFTLAHRLFGDARWLRLAERCAWTTWNEPRVAASLCCGTTGRAYALLNFYNHTGDVAWLERARELAAHAAANAAATPSLWRGKLGADVLAADLASPQTARMPLFE